MEVNFWDFVRNDNSNKGTTARLNETRFGPKKKSSQIYLGPKNFDTFWCTGWAWNCQIIFRCASIHGRAGFILELIRSSTCSCVLELMYSLTCSCVLEYDSSELGEELCPMSSSLYKVYIRVSFLDTFLRWLPPFFTNRCHYQQRKNFSFSTLLGNGCVLISYSMLSLIIAWLG